MKKPLDADVGVVGVGTMGAMTLWQLARRNVSCIGFEQYRVGHELGAGAGESRQFQDNYLEPQVREIMTLAEPGYRQLEADSGFRLLTLTGGLTIGPPDCELISTLLSRIAAEGEEPVFVTHQRMSERYPQHRLRQDDVVIWNERAGFIRPEHAIVAAASSAREQGATIIEGTSISDINPLNGAVRLRSGDRSWTVRQVIVTAGAWAWRLLPVRCRSYIGRLLLTWFPTRHPELFSEDRHLTFTRTIADTTIYGMPSLSYGTVRVGLVGPRSHFTDPEQLDRINVPTSELELITGLVANAMPHLLPTVIKTGTYMDAYTSDGQPLVGPLDPSGDVLLATGFSGRGFKMAAAIGQVMTQLSVEGQSAVNLDGWMPTRFLSAS